MTLAFAVLLLATSAAAAPVREAGRGGVAGEGEQDERFTEGSVAYSLYFMNRDGAASARPDGSGSAFSRLQLQVLDRFNERLSTLADVVFLTDRRGGALKPAAMEYALGGRLRSGPLALQVQRDEALGLDRGGLGNKYWELRGEATMPLAGGAASAGIGWLFHNDGFAARPAPGEAELRYALRFARRDGVLFRVDADLFTERGRGALKPVGADLGMAAGYAFKFGEVELSWEGRRALDGPSSFDAGLLTLRKRFDSRELLE